MSWEEVGAGYTELKDLSGGLNASNEYIDDNQSMDCKNVYGKDKALHKMYGAVGYPEDPVSNGEAVTYNSLRCCPFSSGSSSCSISARI